LLALPSSNLKQLMPELELIRCEREQILVDVDSSLEHVLYPDSGVVSAVAVYSDGRVNSEGRERRRRRPWRRRCSGQVS
jgi:hypothetical protein